MHVWCIMLNKTIFCQSYWQGDVHVYTCTTYLTPNEQFSAISWREQVTFDAVILMFLCTRPTLDWIFIVVAYWINHPRVELSFHSDILSWFRSIQVLLFPLNASCCELMIYRTWVEHANHYAVDAVFVFKVIFE